MPERFSAFSFVDRITALEPGRWARGRFAVPAELAEFSTCLVAEAVGQLAAWVAMAQAEFRRRPVAALSGEMRIEREVAPGEILDLEVEIESGDSDTVAFAGWARLADAPVLALSRCVGPMLPQEDFDDPEAVRGDFETLCGPGARPGRFRGIAKLDLVLIDRVPGQRLRAAMNVPVSAPSSPTTSRGARCFRLRSCSTPRSGWRCGSRVIRCLQAHGPGPPAWRT